MSFNAQSTVHPNKDAILHEDFDDMVILFDPIAGKTYNLNPVGCFVWKAITTLPGLPVSKLFETVHNGCSDISENYQEEVIRFLQSLYSVGLITISPDPVSPASQQEQ